MESQSESGSSERSRYTGVVSSYVGEEKKPKGQLIYTGPDGIGDHKVTVLPTRYVGHTTASPEHTGDVNYICRPAQGCPPPPPKTARVGEVGWGVQHYSDYSLLKTGHQIQLKTFRQADEDKYTHRYQAPYYPMQDSQGLTIQTPGLPTHYSAPCVLAPQDNRLLSADAGLPDDASSRQSSIISQSGLFTRK